MKSFNKKINIAFEAFYAKDFSASCSLLRDAYILLIKDELKTYPAPYYMEKALTVVEELVRIPELEPTDYIKNIISAEKKSIFNQSDNIFESRLASIIGITNLLEDLETIIDYWEEYLGGVHKTTRPGITVSIESKGQFSFFENIYDMQSAQSND